MGKRKAKETVPEAPEVLSLLQQLAGVGFENVKPKEVEEALEMLEITYDAGIGEFYVQQELSVDAAETKLTSREEVFQSVTSYLLSGSADEKGVFYEFPTGQEKVVAEPRHLPDPAEPYVDLVELTQQEERRSEQLRERAERRNALYEQLCQGGADQARQGLESYLSLLEEHLPEISLPGKKDAAKRQEYVARLLTEVAAVRGPTALQGCLEDLERVASEGIPLVTNAFAQSAPELYHVLGLKYSQSFIDERIRRLQDYKQFQESLSPQKKRKNEFEILKYVSEFLLQTDIIERELALLVAREHEDLIPLYAKLKEELKHTRAELTIANGARETLQEAVGKNIQAYDALLKAEKEILDKKYQTLNQTATADAIALEQERDKTARLEDTARGKDTAYRAAAAERAKVLAQLAELRTEYDNFKASADQKLQKAQRWSWGRFGISSLLGGAALGAALYFGLAYTHEDKAGREKAAELQSIADRNFNDLRKLQGQYQQLQATYKQTPAASIKEHISNPAELTRVVKGYLNQVGGYVTMQGSGCAQGLAHLHMVMGGQKETEQKFIDTFRTGKLCKDVDQFAPIVVFDSNDL